MKSFGFACSGLVHAFQEERNLRLFALLHVVIFLAAAVLRIPLLGWVIIVVMMGIFLMTELFNTALERIVDTIDDGEKKRHGGHFHIGLKQAKDTAAAASLVALILECVILCFLFWPFIFRPL